MGKPCKCYICKDLVSVIKCDICNKWFCDNCGTVFEDESICLNCKENEPELPREFKNAEFSVEADIAFDEHLKRLRMGEKEKLWY